MITCFTTFASESGSRAWSESVVEGVLYGRQSHMRKVKGHREIVGNDIYYRSMLIFAYNTLIYIGEKAVGECRPDVKNLHPKKVGPHHLGTVSQQYIIAPPHSRGSIYISMSKEHKSGDSTMLLIQTTRSNYIVVCFGTPLYKSSRLRCKSTTVILRCFNHLNSL
jgi:hypothetical protein